MQEHHIATIFIIFFIGSPLFYVVYRIYREQPEELKQTPMDKIKAFGRSITKSILGLSVATVALLIFSGVGYFAKNTLDNITKDNQSSKEPELIELPLPNTGDADNPNFYGSNPLKIRTQYGQNYLIRISDVQNNSNMASYFIRGGETLNIKVPTGSYSIKYATGDKWYGETHLFGKKTRYTKTEETFHFYNNNGYTIELISQINGNLGSKGIKADQF